MEDLKIAIRPCGLNLVLSFERIWEAFEEASFFAIPVGNSLYVPYLSAIYSPKFYWIAEDMVTRRLPLAATGRSLPKIELNEEEARESWLSVLWLPVTGATDQIMTDSFLTYYSFNPLELTMILPWSAEEELLINAQIKYSQISHPDFDLFKSRISSNF